MALDRPFHRTVRSHVSSPYSGHSSWLYIRDRNYARSPTNYLRAYSIIQADFEKICEYIEPSPESLTAYSYRIHELLMRTCIEIEANFRAILKENICSDQTLNMNVYRKIDVSHHLSSYELILPMWQGTQQLIKPFASWRSAEGFGKGRSPEWYQSYNASKHDRHESFKRANMEQLINALAGLLVVISSQFRTETFSAAADHLALGTEHYHEFDPAIGSLFRIRFPEDWFEADKYDFYWQEISAEPDRFSKYDYDQVR